MEASKNMASNTDQFHTAFFDEAEEHLANMEAALLALEESPGDPDPLNAIFRAAHSIKGTGAIFGFSEIGRFAHALETLLDQMRSGTLEKSHWRIDLLLTSCDILQNLIDAARRGGPPPADLEQVLGQIHDVLGHEDAPAPRARQTTTSASGLRDYRVIFKPGEDLFRRGLDPLLFVRDLADLGDVLETKADFSGLPALDRMDPESCYLAWSLRLRTGKSVEEIIAVFEFAGDTSSVSVEDVTADAVARKNGPPCAEKQRQDGPERRRATLKYLIIDDDPDCCLLVSDILADYGHGHCVHDGTEALVAMRLALQDGDPYELVCLDIMMPNKDGHETLKAIRQLETQHGIRGLKRTKVIMTTSLREAKHCVRCFCEGCEDYVVKPVDHDELLGKMRALGIELP